MTTRELLRKARSIIEDPKRWCKHLTATTVSGKACHPHSDEAFRFCLYGAMDRAEAFAGGGHAGIGRAYTVAGIGRAYTVACNALTDICRREKYDDGWVKYSGPVAFNDDPKTTHSDVMKLIDMAIEEAPAFEEQYRDPALV